MSTELATELEKPVERRRPELDALMDEPRRWQETTITVAAAPTVIPKCLD